MTSAPPTTPPPLPRTTAPPAAAQPHRTATSGRRPGWRWGIGSTSDWRARLSAAVWWPSSDISSSCDERGCRPQADGGDAAPPGGGAQDHAHWQSISWCPPAPPYPPPPGRAPLPAATAHCASLFLAGSECIARAIRGRSTQLAAFSAAAAAAEGVPDGGPRAGA